MDKDVFFGVIAEKKVPLKLSKIHLTTSNCTQYIECRYCRKILSIKILSTLPIDEAISTLHIKPFDHTGHFGS